MDVVRLYLGYDPVEAVAYHTCVESIIRNSSKPVSITPLYLPHLKDYKETHQGSNAFIHSRFLIPYLEKFQRGRSAIFMDGDMVVTSDIAELWEMRDMTKAVQVVKHDYTTKYPKKYLGASNVDYPRKNWSSVMIWNCGHMKNKVLTPEYVMNAGGKELHRFEWLEDKFIGELPKEWNHLCMEQEKPKELPKLIHYTIGQPVFERDDVLDYKNQDYALEFYKYYKSAIYPLKPNPGMSSVL